MPPGIVESVDCGTNLGSPFNGFGWDFTEVMILDPTSATVLPDDTDIIACYFDIADNATPGTYDVTIDSGLTADSMGRAMNTSLVDGTITVGCTGCGCPCAP
jgi:hypothetical protein